MLDPASVRSGADTIGHDAALFAGLDQRSLLLR